VKGILGKVSLPYGAQHGLLKNREEVVDCRRRVESGGRKPYIPTLSQGSMCPAGFADSNSHDDDYLEQTTMIMMRTMQTYRDLNDMNCDALMTWFSPLSRSCYSTDADIKTPG
jgi:hypothetical protein